MTSLFCRFWDGAYMHYVPALQERPESFVGIWVEDTPMLINHLSPIKNRVNTSTFSWQLMWAIGYSERRGIPLYEGDLVEWNDRIWEIGWSTECNAYVLFRATGTRCHYAFSISSLLARQLMVLGNAFEHSDLLRQWPLSNAA